MSMKILQDKEVNNVKDLVEKQILPIHCQIWHKVEREVGYQIDIQVKAKVHRWVRIRVPNNRSL